MMSFLPANERVTARGTSAGTELLRGAQAIATEDERRSLQASTDHETRPFLLGTCPAARNRGTPDRQRSERPEGEHRGERGSPLRELHGTARQPGLASWYRNDSDVIGAQPRREERGRVLFSGDRRAPQPSATSAASETTERVSGTLWSWSE